MQWRLGAQMPSNERDLDAVSHGYCWNEPEYFSAHVCKSEWKMKPASYVDGWILNWNAIPKT